MTRPAFRPFKPRPRGTPKHAVGELFKQKGGVKNVEVLLGLKHATVYAYADPGEPDEIKFAQVAALTDSVGTAAAEYLAARAGGVFLPLPKPNSPMAALTADALRETGQAAAELVASLEGGLSQAEALKALPELDEALRLWAQLRSQVAAIATPEREQTDE